MKNKVVTTISGAVYEDEPLEETVVELLGVAIAIVQCPPFDEHGISVLRAS
jgi:hypothetical protein